MASLDQVATSQFRRPGARVPPTVRHFSWSLTRELQPGRTPLLTRS